MSGVYTTCVYPAAPDILTPEMLHVIRIFTMPSQLSVG